MAAKTYNQLTKARAQPQKNTLTVMKSDDDKRLVFGWANVAVRVDGEQIVDWQPVSYTHLTLPTKLEV